MNEAMKVPLTLFLSFLYASYLLLSYWKESPTFYVNVLQCIKTPLWNIYVMLHSKLTTVAYQSYLQLLVSKYSYHVLTGILTYSTLLLQSFLYSNVLSLFHWSLHVVAFSTDPFPSLLIPNLLLFLLLSAHYFVFHYHHHVTEHL